MMFSSGAAIGNDPFWEKTFVTPWFWTCFPHARRQFGHNPGWKKLSSHLRRNIFWGIIPITGGQSGNDPVWKKTFVTP